MPQLCGCIGGDHDTGVCCFERAAEKEAVLNLKTDSTAPIDANWKLWNSKGRAGHLALRIVATDEACSWIRDDGRPRHRPLQLASIANLEPKTDLGRRVLRLSIPKLT